MENLMDGLLLEMNRARELKKEYDSIPSGKLASMLIQLDIDKAEQSIKDNDVVEMVIALKFLKEIK